MKSFHLNGKELFFMRKYLTIHLRFSFISILHIVKILYILITFLSIFTSVRRFMRGCYLTYMTYSRNYVMNLKKTIKIYGLI